MAEQNEKRGFWGFMGDAFHEHPYITSFAATSIVSTIAAIPAGIIRAIKGPRELPTPVKEMLVTVNDELKDITPDSETNDEES